MNSEAAGDASVLGFSRVVFKLDHVLLAPPFPLPSQAVLFLLFPSDNPLTIHSMSVCNNVIEIWSVVVSAYMLYVLLCSCFFIPLLSFGWRFWRKVMYVPLSLIHKK